MARWLKAADGGSTTYSTGTRVAAVTAGGAMVLASLVVASTGAVADEAPLQSRTATAPAAGPEETVVAGLIVDYAGSSSRLGQAAGAASSLGLGGTVTSEGDGSGVVTFDEPTDLATAERAAERLERLPGVSSVDLNVIHTAAAAPPGGTPKDFYFGYLHGLWDTRTSINAPGWAGGASYKLPNGGYSTKAPSLWRLTKGSKKTVVAVIDTGRTPHADLDANTVAGYDLITGNLGIDPRDGDGRDSDPTDQGDWTTSYNECWLGSEPGISSWHGTHVAGTVAAVNDVEGVVGNAPGVRVQHVRVLGKCGGTTQDIADGITWASGGKVKGTSKNKTPAKVLNLSLGGKIACQPVMQKAINAARKRGSVVIVAAGNNNEDAKNFQPANCKNVITVGASNSLGARAQYSNYGKVVDLSAPGGDLAWGEDINGFPLDGILSTLNDGTTTPNQPYWVWYQGTSMATPGVAGVAALIVSLRPKASTAQLEKAIRGSVTKFPNQTAFGSFNCAKAKNCGKGIIDATKAPTAWLATPKVSGAQVGKTATVSPKAVAPKAKFTYQWLRNGKKIKGATKKTYKVKKADLGKKLSVKVTASLSGFPSRSATTAKVKVGKQSPSVAAKLSAKSIKASKKAKVTITVKTGSLTKKPAGTLKLSYGNKSKTYNLKSSKKGKLTVTLPKLKKGTYKIKVKYTPAKSLKKYVKAKTSKTVKLKVT